MYHIKMALNKDDVNCVIYYISDSKQVIFYTIYF